MTFDEKNYLEHIGVLRKSGRYPWGSGGTQSTRNKMFMDYLADMRKQGLTDSEIAKGVGMTTTQLRAVNSIAINARKAEKIAEAVKLKEKQYSNVAIGQKMGINESSVRSLLAASEKEKTNVLVNTSEMLKRQVDEKGFIDVGTGVEHHVGVSRNRLDVAIAMAKEDGYTLHNVQIDQLGTQNKTNLKVLAPPGTEYRDIVRNKGAIRQITEYSVDGGLGYLGILPPKNISSRKVDVRYAEDGGADADGVIYVRPGKKELSLGAHDYAQVRIGVDGTHYLKGMAIYKKDLPEGVDLQFNTNKSNTGNKLDAMKKQEPDPENPFGSAVHQLTRSKKDGSKEVTSVMNIVNEAGDWDKWSKNLSSQMLSKQQPRLAKQQLEETQKRRKTELEDILKLTNPSVRMKLLETYADSTDAASVHLKAAALPRQRTQVILPVNKMKTNEIYAPNFRDGERVVLIRYPHGGIFEIPELTVNNRNSAAKTLLGRATDAVGIHSKVAERLSGADFDGDTVLVIPNDHNLVKTAPALHDLIGFDPKRQYPAYEGMKPMTSREKGVQMGYVSNLITDMTIKGASTAELARAVKHSMVVIDAEKHNLNYKLSAQENGIKQLMTKYQNRAGGGASTLVSRATSDLRVNNRTPRRPAEGGPIDPATGKKMFTPTGESFINKQGKVEFRKFKSTKLAETDDAHTLSSGTTIEKLYADHSNRLKALANQARKELVATQTIPVSASAKKVYAPEVNSLNRKLRVALMNRPHERAAQILAKTTVDAKIDANPNMDKAEIKKLKGMALTEARVRLGAKKIAINIEPREWEAIQNGAVSKSKLSEILDNADLKQVKELATPRTKLLMGSAEKARAQSLANAGYTQAEIADALGVSLTTLKDTLSGGDS